MNTSRLQSLLAENTLVQRFYYYEEIDSTMSQARRLVMTSQASHYHGTLIVANHQTGGKGRHGRTWSAPAGTSVLATIILAKSKLPVYPEPTQLSLLSSAIPVAVCRGIGNYVPEARIKYPNDIVAGGRKLGGILLEACGDMVFAGFGVNCTQSMDDFPTDTKTPASSILLETGLLISPENLLDLILSNIEEVLRPDVFVGSVDYMNSLCETLGRVLHIDTGDEILVGIARNIDPDGKLILETLSGPKVLHSSEVIRTWFPDHQEDDV